MHLFGQWKTFIFIHFKYIFLIRTSNYENQLWFKQVGLRKIHYDVNPNNFYGKHYNILDKISRFLPTVHNKLSHSLTLFLLTTIAHCTMYELYSLILQTHSAVHNLDNILIITYVSAGCKHKWWARADTGVHCPFSKTMAVFLFVKFVKVVRKRLIITNVLGAWPK